MLVSVNATIETLVYNVLNLFNIDDLDVKKYLLKIHGLEEYLPIDSTLADLKYIRDCLIENREPVLVLVELKNANTELTTKDDKAKSEKFTFNLDLNEECFDDSMSSLFTKLESLLKGIVNNRKSLIDSLNEYAKTNSSNHIDLIVSWLVNLKEKVKGAVNAFNLVTNDSVNTILERLETFEAQIKGSLYKRSMKERQPLITSEENYDYKIADKYGASSAGSSSGDVFGSLTEFIASDLLAKLAVFINSVARNYFLPFRVISVSKSAESPADLNLNSDEENEEDEKVEIIQANDKFFIYFNGLSRLGSFLSSLTPTLK